MNLNEAPATLTNVRLAGRKEGMKVKFYLALACVPGEAPYTELVRLLPEVDAIRKASKNIPAEHQPDEEDDAEDTSRPKGGVELEVEADRLGNVTHTLTIHALPPADRQPKCPPLVHGPCRLDKRADVLVSGNYPRLNLKLLVEAVLLPEVTMPNVAEWSGNACYLTLVQTQAELAEGEATKPKKRKKAAQLKLDAPPALSPKVEPTPPRVAPEDAAPSAGPADAPKGEPERPEPPSLDDARASWADRKGAALLNKGKAKLDAVIKAADERGGVYGYLDDAETLALVWLRPGSAKDLTRAPIAHAWCVVGRIDDGWIAVPVVRGKAAALNPEIAPPPTASTEWMAAVSASDEAGAPPVEFATLTLTQLKALDRETVEGGRTKLDEFLAPLDLPQLQAQHFAADAGPSRATSPAFVRNAIANHVRGRGIR